MHRMIDGFPYRLELSKLDQFIHGIWLVCSACIVLILTPLDQPLKYIALLFIMYLTAYGMSKLLQSARIVKRFNIQ